MSEIEKTKVTISGVVIAANIALSVFLFTDVTFLKDVELLYNFVHYALAPILMISAVLLYFYILLTGVKLLRETDEPVSPFIRAALSLETKRLWFYKQGMSLSFYAFTFSIPSYLGGMLVV